VWTFKGCAGRLDAAKHLVEGITISAISKLPQTPALPLCVYRKRRQAGCVGSGSPFEGIQAVGNQRDQPVSVEGAEKLLDL